MATSTHTRQARTGRDGYLADLQVKVAAWRRERDLLVKEIRDVLEAAQSMVADIDGWSPWTAKRPGAVRRKITRKRKRHFSPAARARMSEAAKRRWAKVRRRQRASG